VIAVLGVPLVGILLGPIAAVCGALALSQEQGGDRRGSRLAIAGMALGIAEFAGWAIAVFVLMSRTAPHRVEQEADLPFLATRPALGIADAPPHIRRALRANLRVVCDGPGGGEGSGIVVARSTDAVWFATNQHVVRCAAEGKGKLLAFAPEGEKSAAEIRWLAPHGMDLALVRAGPLPGLEVIPVHRHKARVGDAVFVVGNPLGLAATYTSGIVSAFRTTETDGQPVHVLQVQAAINHGNSGGGLYDSSGELLGVVTWTMEKRIGEGIGFAISVDDLLGLLEGTQGIPAELAAAGATK
jgi:S1-C subfamily serine protease